LFASGSQTNALFGRALRRAIDVLVDGIAKDIATGIVKTAIGVGCRNTSCFVECRFDTLARQRPSAVDLRRGGGVRRHRRLVAGTLDNDRI